MLTYIDLYPVIYNGTDVVYTQDRSTLCKMANSTGKTVGKVKNFFSKSETKATTLVAYWAADTLVALLLLITAFNATTLVLIGTITVLHTYATFGVLLDTKNR